MKTINNKKECEKLVQDYFKLDSKDKELKKELISFTEYLLEDERVLIKSINELLQSLYMLAKNSNQPTPALKNYYKGFSDCAVNVADCLHNTYSIKIKKINKAIK